jgi:penicillin amidase
MADDLTGNTDDIPLSYVHNALGDSIFNQLYPERIAGNIPVIPGGTKFPKPTMQVPPTPTGNLFADFRIKNNGQTAFSQVISENNSGIGSNNWAVSGQRTASGDAILCNDPHLGLNLPAIWYEIQLSAPGINCYGVSIPGAPGIVIGFNDSISWGLTNNYRDVKDYYELRSDTPGYYIMDNTEQPFHNRYEKITIKGKKTPFTDTVRYTVQGPVLYDNNFPEPSGSGKTLAVTWMAHRGSNELLSLYLLNRAENYSGFVQAIVHFECPAQNFIYADGAGNIAIWGQGRFINKWPGQGKFVMRGDISATLWGDTIPMLENPHVFNPPDYYLASANQQVTDESYPYYYNGDFSEFRSWEINRFLKDSSKITPEGMMALQNNVWSLQAYRLAPYYNAYGATYVKDHPEYFRLSNALLSPGSKAASAFEIWLYFLNQNIWKDNFVRLPLAVYPSPEKTMQLILEDTTSPFFDDVSTTEKEGFNAIVQRSFRQTWDSVRKLEQHGGSEWYKVKNTTVMHLAKIDAFSFSGLQTGGWGTTINAMKHNHGPSWRMVVAMHPGKIKAWGVYPGGQSGNPGSKYYATFLNYWVKGKYYPIRFDKQ